jgi:hypothetical protein
MHIYGSGGGVGEAQRGAIEFWPKTGLPRSGLVGTLEASIAFNSAFRIVSTITWLESATAITSLRIKANVAGGIKAGSVLTLYKVSPSGSSGAQGNQGNQGFQGAGSGDVGVSVGKSVNQTITNVTPTDLTWNTEDWDTNGFHDNAVNNERLTVPLGFAGKYLVLADATFDANASGSRIVTIQKNGAGTHINDSRDAVSSVGLGTSISISGYLDLAVGDFVTVNVYQTSGGNLDVLGSTVSRFQMQKVG